jgi:hypothetical protein
MSNTIIVAPENVSQLIVLRKLISVTADAILVDTSELSSHLILCGLLCIIELIVQRLSTINWSSRNGELKVEIDKVTELAKLANKVMGYMPELYPETYKEFQKVPKFRSIVDLSMFAIITLQSGIEYIRLPTQE